MISFNNVNCEEYGLIVKDLISIPSPEKNIKEIQIPGRDGSLHEDEGTYKDIKIPINFNFLAAENSCNEIMRKARDYLDQSGKLVLDEDKQYFYKCKYVQIEDMVRENKRVCSFAANFICEPFCYLQSGQNEIKNPSSLYNPGYIAKPLYKIVGEGSCRFTVNEKEFTANIGSMIYIDSDLQISYREDGASANTSLTGDYDDLILKNGNNTLSISSGFDLFVIPRWRYR